MARSTHSSNPLRARPRRSRLAAVVAGATALAAVLAATLAGPAFADSKPTNPSDSATPPTVTADALPTPQINGVVWTQTIVGNTVFAGGSFTTARPYGVAHLGKGTVERWNILSYNLTTGVLNTAFAPQLNGQVKAIVGTPDQKHVFVAGTFTKVGKTTANHVVELGATSGAVIPSFKATTNYTVDALALDYRKNNVYLGGDFTTVDSKARTRLAAVSVTQGALRPWAPSANGTVRALAVDPDHSKVVVGGAFSTLDGKSKPGYGIGAVNTTSGSLLPWAMNSVIRDAGINSAILSLASTSTGVYGSGYVYNGAGNLEGTFRADWKTGALTWMEDCHGDTYSVAIAAGVEYEAGHAHNCSTVGGFPDDTSLDHYRAVAFSTAATHTLTANTVAGYSNFAGQPAPSLLDWFPAFDIGTFTGQNQGPWSVAASAKYVVYGGEFTTVNGIAQQGLTRFAVPSLAPNKMGPEKSGATFMPTVTATPTSATVSWTANADPDNENLTYTVLRDDVPVYTVTGPSWLWNEPTMSWTDTDATALTPGSSPWYRIRATDAFGNTVIGDSTTVTIPAAPSTAPDPGAAVDSPVTPPAAPAAAAPAAATPAAAPAAPAADPAAAPAG
ncbi:hypothetical protein AX769_08055 [Frondihabitans sp. PAMC 28766]|uniref:hypothetical protein n=1 Tax=Frondihabitans sp. PAMC 28766 TaxID=1795630 RepID=UPI00078B8DF1|nr:hypothetical protein [Frondihabitans sp. PAMC 28766]AMM20128.1 hypothetical protein AX769_08055 [Frondihabitans sp. PAMC 28766]